MAVANGKKAVFLDRDGVVNVDNGYVSKVDDFEFIEGVIEACKKLKEKGYLLVVVTNQSGIARGYFSEEQFHTLTEWMDWSLADRGVDLDGIFYCPHHAEKGVGEFKIDCDCRKPKPGMLLDAARDHGLDLSRSFMVGDRWRDVGAGINAGCRTLFIDWGYDERLTFTPNAVVDDIAVETRALNP